MLFYFVFVCCFLKPFNTWELGKITSLFMLLIQVETSTTTANIWFLISKISNIFVHSSVHVEQRRGEIEVNILFIKSCWNWNIIENYTFAYFSYLCCYLGQSQGNHSSDWVKIGFLILKYSIIFLYPQAYMKSKNKKLKHVTRHYTVNSNPWYLREPN